MTQKRRVDDHEGYGTEFALLGFWLLAISCAGDPDLIDALVAYIFASTCR